MLNIKNVLQSRFEGDDIYSDEILLKKIQNIKQYLKERLGLEVWLENGVFFTGDYDNFTTTDKTVKQYLQYWLDLVHIIDSM